MAAPMTHIADDDLEIEIDEQHSNQNGKFCCPHCFCDNEIDGWHRSDAGVANKHNCDRCGKDFAYTWREETVQVSGFIEAA